jgi:hypothetical protein
MRAPPFALTAEQIHALLVQTLIRAEGGTPDEWARAVGKVRVRPMIFNVLTNWRVNPAGTPEQKRCVRAAVARVREHHPYGDL